MATMNEKDYYEILGVSKDATSRDIQKAFQHIQIPPRIRPRCLGEPRTGAIYQRSVGTRRRS